MLHTATTGTRSTNELDFDLWHGLSATGNLPHQPLREMGSQQDCHHAMPNMKNEEEALHGLWTHRGPLIDQ